MPTFTLSDGADLWLRNGEHGLSSRAIFSFLTGLDIRGSWAIWGYHTPSDPADLRRCLLLLLAAPDLRARFPEMRKASDKWAVMVDHWEELSALFNEEAPNWRTQEHWEAPRTFDRMMEIRDGNKKSNSRKDA